MADPLAEIVILLRPRVAFSKVARGAGPWRLRKEEPPLASFRQMLKALEWAGKYSPHATRTTGSTRLNDMGYSADWIEGNSPTLNPMPCGARITMPSTSNRAEMMQQWADMLDAWKKGDGAKVVPLHSAVA